MGLIHPTDLGAWQASIATRQSPLRRIRNRFRSQATEPAVLVNSGPDSEVLIVVDSLSPSQLAALVAPMTHLAADRVAVLTTPAAAAGSQFGQHLESLAITDEADLTRALPGLRCVVAVGDYMRLGSLAGSSATHTDAAFLVVQHGILTPFAPPLRSGAELLAWSEADANYWTAGRSDVSAHTVGSQLLFAAHRRAAELPTRSNHSSLTYLGQLHGHELPRRLMAQAAVSFCRSNDAAYRPHPSEIDLMSRLQHRLWRMRGIRFDLTNTPLTELDTEVVSAFSTGVLEAAAAGMSSWVDFPDPPAWLRETWERYGMPRYGTDASRPTFASADEPARVIAQIIEERVAQRR